MLGGALPKKPALLRGGMFLCWLYGFLLGLFLLILAVAGTGGIIAPAMAMLGPGNGMMITEQLSANIYDAARVVVVPLLIISVAAAYALAKDLAWSRPLLMILLVLGVVTLPLTPGIASPLTYGISIALLGFGCWYLYRKPNVVAYYAAVALKARIEDESAG
jgi:hypothetical protein